MNEISKAGQIWITPHFSLSEMCHSKTADQYGWDNIPDWSSLVRLNQLCLVLEQVRSRVGLPIIINSGYRSFDVNAAVGGASDSYHMCGRAADIRCADMDKLRDVLNQFDWTECIDYSTYIHIAL